MDLDGRIEFGRGTRKLWHTQETFCQQRPGSSLPGYQLDGCERKLLALRWSGNRFDGDSRPAERSLEVQQRPMDMDGRIHASFRRWQGTDEDPECVSQCFILDRFA